MKEVVMKNEQLMPAIVKIINEGHTVTLRLRGRSMRPFLEDNRDIALLSMPRKPRKGEPVLAEVSPGRYVLHRIISVKGDDIVLRGDGNIGTERCKRTDIRASVIGFYRKGRGTLDRIDGRKWRVYSWFWTRLFPVRRYLLAFYRIVWLRLSGGK